MRIDILTLFPKMFDHFVSESIIKRAIQKELVTVNIIDIRTFSTLKNNQVDDTPYGGGSGMVLMCEPVVSAIESVKDEDAKVILLTPQGVTYHQKMAYQFRDCKHLILVCGHYEGFDERIRSFVDMEVSIGDFVLTGGELPAMVIADSVIRLVKGVITEESFLRDSFTEDLLDYPTYTKPVCFRGMQVPEVLLSGNHQKIDEFRQNSRYNRTKERRPDLLEK